MIICRTVREFVQQRQALRESAGGGAVGFVATMGYLHAGHARMIEQARGECGTVIVSVFVNPLQFGPNEDFAAYPRDLAHDAALAEQSGADLLFAPDADDLFGKDGGRCTVHVAQLGEHLCGASRPGHFDGVCTVLAVLFHLVSPQRAYFGRKDAQQWRIVRRMARDLRFPVEIVPVETVREADGLAVSSRNVYLSQDERKAAPVLRRALAGVAAAVQAGERSTAALRDVALRVVAAEPLVRLDYLSFVDGESLQPVRTVADGGPTVCAVAAFVGKTRLIDNVELV